MVRQQYLQVAYGIFLVVITAGVGIETRAPVVVHTYVMAGFMKDRMQWRIGPHQQFITDEPGLFITPETARYVMARWNNAEYESKLRKQCAYRCRPDVGKTQDIFMADGPMTVLWNCFIHL